MEGDDEYFLPQSIISRLQNALQNRADSEYRDWQVSYFKLNIPVRGVRMQEIRFEVHQWHRTWEAEAQLIPSETERLIALQLLRQSHLEDKLAAIVYINETLIPRQRITASHLHLFEPVFAAGHVSNRKIGDGFANKVLVPLLVDAPGVVSGMLRDRWLSSRDLWQARSALIALAELVRDAVHQEALLMGCRVLLRREETEAKSGVGSALRALAKCRPEPVVEFLNDDGNLVLFDAASLGKATLNLDELQATRFKARRRLLQMQPGPGGGSRDDGASASRESQEASRIVEQSTAEGVARTAAGGSGERQEEAVEVSVGLTPGAAAAAAVGSAMDPLGVGAGILEVMDDGSGFPGYGTEMSMQVGSGQDLVDVGIGVATIVGTNNGTIERETAGGGQEGAEHRIVTADRGREGEAERESRNEENREARENTSECGEGAEEERRVWEEGEGRDVGVVEREGTGESNE